MVHGILYKHYTSLMNIVDECCSFLHKSQIFWKLPKPSNIPRAMASGHVLCYIIDNAMVVSFLHFYKNNFNTNQNHMSHGGSPIVCISYQIDTTNSFKAISLQLKCNLNSNVSFKYLMKHHTTIQCSGPTLDMSELTVLIANARPALYSLSHTWVILLPQSLYELPSISPCTFPSSCFKSLNNLEFTLEGVTIDVHFSMLKQLRTFLMYLL